MAARPVAFMKRSDFRDFFQRNLLDVCGRFPRGSRSGGVMGFEVSRRACVGLIDAYHESTAAANLFVHLRYGRTALKRLLVEFGGHVFTSNRFWAALAAPVEFDVFGLRLHDGAGRQ